MSEQIHLSGHQAIVEGQTEEPGRSTHSETGIQSGLVRTSQSTQTTSCQTRSVGSNTKPLLGEDATRFVPIQKISEEHTSLDNICSEAELDDVQLAVEHFARKEERAATSMRKRLRDFLDREESSSDEERLARKERRQERESIRALRKKIRHLEAKMDALERRNDRLEDLLVSRLASRFSRQSQWGGSDRRVNGTRARSAAQNCSGIVSVSRPGTSVKRTTVDMVSRPETSVKETTGDMEPNGSTTPALSWTDQQEPNGSTAPALPESDEQVDIGEGVCISLRSWQQLLCARRDSLFCKGAVKVLWSASELKDRSVTGQPCRRFHGSQAKRALTPVKLKAVANAFKVFIENRPNEVPAAQRLRRLNYYVGELLNDQSK